MMLGVFFTGAFLAAAPVGMAEVFEPALAGIGAALAGLLGCFLGWFNVTILLRVPVDSSPRVPDRGSGRSTPRGDDAR
jgi:hypothetical protein